MENSIVFLLLLMINSTITCQSPAPSNNDTFNSFEEQRNQPINGHTTINTTAYYFEGILLFAASALGFYSIYCFLNPNNDEDTLEPLKAALTSYALTGISTAIHIKNRPYTPKITKAEEDLAKIHEKRYTLSQQFPKKP
jgi:hypothetical protein